MTVTARTRQIVRERDEWTCQRCGTYIGPFGLYSLQHRRPRGMGGTKRPETDLPGNLILLCGSATSPGGCHSEVETNRHQATVDGYLVGQTVEPSKVPVRTWRGWAYLDDDGMLVLTGDDAEQLTIEDVAP